MNFKKTLILAVGGLLLVAGMASAESKDSGDRNHRRHHRRHHHRRHHHMGHGHSAHVAVSGTAVVRPPGT